MELRQLRYLVAISKEQNVSRAARLCFVTQPALTQQIHKLEEEFNTSLLIRRGRGIILSKDGERLTKHAKQLIKKIDEIKEEFLRTDNNNINHIELGVVPALYQYCDSIINSELSEANNQLKIKLRKMGVDQIEYELGRGIINAAISPRIPNLKNISKKVVSFEKIFLISSKLHRVCCSGSIGMESILDEPLVMLDEKNTSRKYLDDYLLKKKLKMKVMLEVKSASELFDVIKNSNFISFLPNSLIPKSKEDQIFKTDLEDKIYRDNYLYWNKQDSGSEKIQFLEEHFPNFN